MFLAQLRDEVLEVGQRQRLGVGDEVTHPRDGDLGVGRLVLGGADDDATVLALFARQGRHELRAWAAHRDPALGEWVALLHPPEPAMPTYLPERPVLLLCTHHETRAARA